jgi:hypothetical protein
MELGSRHNEAWVKELLEAAGDYSASGMDCKTMRQQLRLQVLLHEIVPEAGHLRLKRLLSAEAAAAPEELTEIQ